MQVIKGIIRCTVMLLLVSNVHAATAYELIQKDWILQSLNGIKIALETYPGKKPRIKFFDDLRFTAWAGCNEIAGNYYFKEPDLLYFDQNMIMTKMACNWPQNVENELIQALQSVKKVEIDTDLMRLYNDQEKIVAIYAALQIEQVPAQ